MILDVRSDDSRFSSFRSIQKYRDRGTTLVAVDVYYLETNAINDFNVSFKHNSITRYQTVFYQLFLKLSTRNFVGRATKAEVY